MVNPLGNATHYTYDSSLNLTQTTDAAGQIWTNTYDTKGNLIAATEEAKACPKIRRISVAGLIADAIREIDSDGSISRLNLR